MQRRESVTSDPRKALSRCLAWAGKRVGKQAEVTLKLAQPLHMSQEACVCPVLASQCHLPEAAGDLGWGRRGGCSPQPLKAHWPVFSVLGSEPDLSLQQRCFLQLSTGVKVDPAGTELTPG